MKKLLIVLGIAALVLVVWMLPRLEIPAARSDRQVGPGGTKMFQATTPDGTVINCLWATDYSWTNGAVSAGGLSCDWEP